MSQSFRPTRYCGVEAELLRPYDIIESHDDLDHVVIGVTREVKDRKVVVDIKKSDDSQYTTEFQENDIVRLANE